MSGLSLSKSVTLVAPTHDTARALLDNDLERASELTGLALSDFYTERVISWIWSKRLEEDSQSDNWRAHFIVDNETGIAVGHAGFHGVPDENGLVEIGYSIEPCARRRGYGRATVAALLARCASEPAVHTVRASISPDNAASLATIAGFGFTRVGEQIDEEDGLEYIYDRPAKGSVSA